MRLISFRLTHICSIQFFYFILHRIHKNTDICLCGLATVQEGACPNIVVSLIYPISQVGSVMFNVMVFEQGCLKTCLRALVKVIFTSSISLWAKVKISWFLLERYDSDDL